MKLRHGLFLLIIFCVSGSGIALAAPPNKWPPLEITDVYADVDAGTLMIIGAHFDNGYPPVITLGGFPVPVNTTTADMIDSALPAIADGDHLLVVSTGVWPYQNASFYLTIGAVGSQGPQGEPGTDGAPGADGADGASGADGADGAPGPAGPPGPPGQQGETGEQGPRGLKGDKGDPGDTGPSGADELARLDLCSVIDELNALISTELAVPEYCISTDPDPRRMFVTSTRYVSFLIGGQVGGDATCQAHAEEAGLSGSYHAWLSGGPDDVVNLEPVWLTVLPSVAYVRTDGELIAASGDDLLNGTILNPINRDQWGVEVAPTNVWTGIAFTPLNIEGDLRPTEYFEYPEWLPSGVQSDPRFVQCGSWGGARDLTLAEFESAVVGGEPPMIVVTGYTHSTDDGWTDGVLENGVINEERGWTNDTVRNCLLPESPDEEYLELPIYCVEQ